MPNSIHHNTKAEELVVLTAYYAVLVAFLVASFFPQYRLWGVNWWAYFPGYVPFVLFAIGAMAPIVMQLVLRRGKSDVGDERASADKSSKYLIIVFCLTVLYALAFYLLRAKTHFLGDGLTSLSYLASDNPLLRKRELGESLVHIWLKSALGGDPKGSALLSFQIISISAGIGFLIATTLFARLLFKRVIDRVLFFLGLASGGYMLLFFGYVEYYSMFVCTVGVFSLIGLLAVKSKTTRWLILPVLGLAIFFHVLGVILVPSAIYVLLVNSRLGNKISRLNRWVKFLSALLVVMLVIAVFSYFYKTNYFFQFAFVPIIANRFTAEGYTLLSVNHLVDFLNLLILLLPAFPIFAAVLFFLPVRSLAKRREYRYLAILLLSTLGAAFIFDPKMGMPRDWDLFSFSGVPLALFFYFLILDNSRRIASWTTVCSLSVMLGLTTLLLRVSTHNRLEASIAQFEHYIALDKKKCAQARALLVNYYLDVGSITRVNIELSKWEVEVPEKRLFDNVYQYVQSGDCLQAIPLLRQITKMNPMWQRAWANLGFCYVNLQDYDSAVAYLRIALGINPYDAASLGNLGVTYLYLKDYEKAENTLLKSISLENSSADTHYNLIWLYKHLLQQDKLFKYLYKAASKKDSPMLVFKELGDYYLNRAQYRKAGEMYEITLNKGLDSAYVNQLTEKHPQLLQHFFQQTGSPGSPDDNH